VAVSSVAGAEAQTAEQQLAAAHKALRATRGLQFDFATIPQPKPPAWLAPLVEFLQLFGPVLQYVFWGGVIIGLVLIAYFILREFVPETWFRKRRAGEAPADWRPEPEKARALLEDADGLAAAGQFEAAIHLLLFRSIDDLVARRPGAVRPALTSRDIAGLEVLPGEARAAFARLAQAVERTFFGGRPAGADEFGRARQDYEAFAFAEGWR
jgi:hypothetical protein